MTTPPEDSPDLALTAGDVVALVAQQIEVSGARPVLTDDSREAAERAAEDLLDSLSGEQSTPPKRANGAEHDSD
ncbi:hypothetical protein [Cryptosporangium sp. NPDC048952]|uniref:hypothetical protein n=1 Tax=Cryptosporangium sp. NPDC048952 TaxID=3363961 RepID=UPI0037238A4A